MLNSIWVWASARLTPLSVWDSVSTSVAEVTYLGMFYMAGCISAASAKSLLLLLHSISESEDDPDEDDESEELEDSELDEEPDVEEVAGGECLIFLTLLLLVTTANKKIINWALPAYVISCTDVGQ